MQYRAAELRRFLHQHIPFIIQFKIEVYTPLCQLESALVLWKKTFLRLQDHKAYVQQRLDGLGSVSSMGELY